MPFISLKIWLKWIINILKLDKGILKYILSGISLVSISGIQCQELVTRFDKIGEREGLDWNFAREIIQDKFGFIWIGTAEGLLKYDGYKFIKYTHDPRNANSLSHPSVTELLEDSNGDIWIGTIHGLNRLNRETQNFTQYYQSVDSLSLSSNHIFQLFKDSENRIWVGTSSGLHIYNNIEDSFCTIKTKGELPSIEGSQVFTLLENQENFIWIGTSSGLFKYNKRKKLTEFQFNTQSDVRKVFIASNGDFWIGTSKGLLKLKNDSLVNFPYADSLENFIITDIVEDFRGFLWISTTRNGIIELNPNRNIYKRHFHSPTNPMSLKSSRINNLYIDQFDNLWICTLRGVQKLELDAKAYEFYQQEAGYENELNAMLALHIDKNNGIWFDTGGPSFYYSPILGLKGQKMTFPSNSVGWSPLGFYSDSKKRVWQRYRNHGLVYFDLQLQEFTKPDLGDTINNSTVIKFQEDLEKKENYWLITSNGLCKLNHNLKNRTWYYIENQEPTLNYITFTHFQNNTIWGFFSSKQGKRIFYFDKKKHKKLQVYKNSFTIESFQTGSIRDVVSVKDVIWIGTTHGLFKFNPSLDTMLHITTFEGLAENNIRHLILDKRDNLWIVCKYNVTKYIPPLDSFFHIRFPQEIGLVHSGSSSLSEDGKLLLIGGANGIISLNPDSIVLDQRQSELALTNFKINGEVSYSDTLPEFINSIFLKHYQNDFSFEFALLNYSEPEATQYWYKLENYDNDWKKSEPNRIANYTNIDPGEYKFLVKATNRHGIKNEKEIAIPLSIAPPWWRTWWAYLMYLIIFVSSIYALYRFQLDRQLSKAEAGRLKELDEIKTKLYTNITHEFRTPLTIILGLADQVIANPKEWLQEGIQLIRRNGNQLLNLVNQMLDLAKLESGSLPVSEVQGDIIKYLKYLIESFQTLAESKEVSLHFLTELNELIMDYDQDKMQNIISNLLSNAIKFTPPGGNIYFQLAKVNKHKLSFLKISVKDSGTGIPKDQLPHIFDRFYQVDASTTRKGEGTGIGLTLTKELVHLLDGTIEVESKMGAGTVFKIHLPIKKEISTPIATEDFSVVTSPTRLIVSDATETKSSKKNEIISSDIGNPLLLIIEDNQDVVQYLVACLKNSYQIISANNGQEGIEKATELIPDIIISDVMMPEKDGFEVCETLKNDERTDHIPIVLLTAKADIDSKIHGLKEGADAYLPKPFNKTELEVQLENLIVQRKKLQVRFLNLTHKSSEESENVITEEPFLVKVKQLIEQNMEDTEFDVSRLARLAGMSRVQLYRKIKALTNVSPSLFIRSVQLQKAKQLLIETNLNISEIAYEIGFSDPSFFSRNFKEEFGHSPTEFRASNRKN